MIPPPDTGTILAQVDAALTEDLGDGDASAQLIPERTVGPARLISRESAVLCGQAWFNACFTRRSPEIRIDWTVQDGDWIEADKTLCQLHGPARALLSAERTALNFLQTLSGTATTTAHCISQLHGRTLQIMDTRKTLPGLRLAQKYAVRCGGGHNHRLGLYDAILIKENHILAGGGISKMLQRVLQTGLPVVVEVEDLNGLREALEAGAQHILLDNLDEDILREAVRINARRARLEVSGNLSCDDLPRLADCGVDCVSLGALTKHLRAIDFSLRYGRPD